ncbi:MAG: hypothetical protein H0V34_08300 [Gammaproteobacteria bacterium]|nr:hypothetical protein [Gammaproteobacteria bacterium]
MKNINPPDAIALATAAAALFVKVSLPGCATQLAAREQAARQAANSSPRGSIQDQYPGPARPCTVNICGRHRDCKRATSGVCHHTPDTRAKSVFSLNKNTH